MRLRTSAQSLRSKANRLTSELSTRSLAYTELGFSLAQNWTGFLSQPSLDQPGWEAKINVRRLPSGGRHEYSGICSLWRPQVGFC